MFAVMKTLALAVILLWCALPTVALDPAARFTRYGMEQGLPQMYVTRITQDVQGFLWVATQDGLARFDGHTMVVHRARPADPTSIAGNHVHALVVAHDSMLYASTGGGIAHEKPGMSFLEYLLHVLITIFLGHGTVDLHHRVLAPPSTQRLAYHMNFLDESAPHDH